jgi:hypothetical protein
MRHVLLALTALAAVVLLASPALADWDEGDYYKWVQYPDPNGWDVDFTARPDQMVPGILADDFLCTERGLITDVHLWFSVQRDKLEVPIYEGDQVVGYRPISPMEAIESIHLSIHDNIPAGVDDISWSRPGLLRWEGTFQPASIRFYGEGDQGFIWPYESGLEYSVNNHTGIWQANILIDPIDAFPQEGLAGAAKIYWLDASMKLKPDVVGAVGWKTTFESQLDDAVYWVGDASGGGGGWYPLHDPTIQPPGYRSLDLAFVITPEPSTVVMLIGAGLIGLLVHGRRRKRS